ncbi:MAG TPA: transposase [Candidatus Bathyarchaeia archaeon]|nr:transposase [Candidatus Bathyarchaeia archaeon]
MKDSTKTTRTDPLIKNLLQLISAHRPAFRQGRTYRRSVGMVLGEIFSFARHTVTQTLLALGMTDGDWSAWYRLFSRPRFDEAQLNDQLLTQTLVQAPENEPYTVAVDGTQLHRSSLKMPGTSWLRDARFSAFRPGIHRAQRFLHGAWLTPIAEGFSRAIPLRFLPAFPPKAVAAEGSPCKEWEAALVFLKWVRAGLDRAGRQAQPILALADGGFDVLDLWRSLPERVILVTRSARNRALFWLPKAADHPGPGRPASYGDPAPHPADWLHKGLRNWPQQSVRVRGQDITMKYQVLGPFVRDGLPERPLFLIVVKGLHRLVGKSKTHYKHKDPSFYLVSAVQREGQWVLPFAIPFLLTWLWQRWEIEVAHREMKSGLGVGEKQCWNTRSAVVSVQWSVWVYAILLLAGYRTWGLLGGPATPARWWPGAKRWSLSTLWRAYRAALWEKSEFQALWTTTGDNWWKKETWLAGLENAVAGAARI